MALADATGLKCFAPDRSLARRDDNPALHGVGWGDEVAELWMVSTIVRLERSLDDPSRLTGNSEKNEKQKAQLHEEELSQKEKTHLPMPLFG